MTARYLFDRWGTCLGYVDAAGRYCDAQGRQIATVRDGRVYGRDGLQRGRVDVQGQVWREDGMSLGYLGAEVPVSHAAERVPFEVVGDDLTAGIPT